jgi:hypothetical protein
MPAALTLLYYNHLCLWCVRGYTFAFGWEMDIGRKEKRKDKESSVYRVRTTMDFLAKISLIS